MNICSACMISLNVAIIGSGIAGIATSIRLANKGHQVTVFEKNSYPGGKLAQIEQNGYRFDAGPSLFTMASLVDELFQLSGKNPRKFFEYKQLEIACKYFFEDGIVINAYTDRNKFAREIEYKLGVDENILLKHLNHSQKIHSLVSKLFMEKSLHRLRSYLSYDTIKAIINFHQLDISKTLDQVNRKRLKHPKLVQMFNRFATYNGSNPYQAPGILNIIPNLEHNLGTYFPKGGMYNITKSLYKLARKLGVVYHFNSEAKRIVVDDKRIKGLQVGSRLINFDRIISNADIYPTYRNLLPEYKMPAMVSRQTPSSSALIFYWGVNRTFTQLDLHNIFFSENYQEEFDHIFSGQTVYHDPTVYINITSKYQPEDAPEGCENWFVMINVPYNNGQDWDQIIARARISIIKKLSRMLNISLEEHIESESILDPRSIEDKTSSYRGSLYGASHNDRLAALKRHPNFTQRIKGLYFCGGSVHPGGGIPLCMLSAKIVDDILR